MMTRRPAFIATGLARKGLLAIGVSLLAVAVLATAEGLLLRWLGFSWKAAPDRISVLHFCAPKDKGPAASVFWLRSAESSVGLRHGLQLHSWPLGRASVCYAWDHLTPRSATWIGAHGKLALGSLEGTIYTWDASNRDRTPQALGSHLGCAMLLAADADGRWLASANDWLLCLWDVAERRLRWRRTDLIVNCVILHPLSNNLICGTAMGEVLELDLNTGCTLRIVTRHAAGVDCVAISNSGARVASIGYDRRLIVTDWQSAQTVWCQRHYPGGEVCFSPDGTTLVSAGYTDDCWSLLAWDAASGDRRSSFVGHTGPILGLTFTSDETLYSWGSDGTIRTWDLALGQPTSTYRPDPSC
jgi:hypothetical protein